MTKVTTSFQKVSLNSPQSLANFASVLKKFIVERQLYTDIKGKDYVNVEGWEFAGASIGVYPIVKQVNNLSDEKEIKYSAHVELVQLSTQKVIGAGVAICSNKERSKTTFDEYAIASMAQTRAIGKAYRNAFAWLMKMAGYEATPAEEAVYESYEEVEPVVEIPLQVIKDRVTAKLEAMSPADKLRTLKGTGHTSLGKLTVNNWRYLDAMLGTDKEAEDE